MDRSPATAPSDEDLLDTVEAAPIVGVEPATLEVWRCTGRQKIPYIKVGRLVRYRRGALKSWLKSQTVVPA